MNELFSVTPPIFILDILVLTHIYLLSGLRLIVSLTLTVKDELSNIWQTCSLGAGTKVIKRWYNIPLTSRCRAFAFL